MTLMETLVAVAIILTLVGVLAATGKKLRRHSEVELTRSTLAVLDAALEVYYTQYDAYVPMASTQAQFEDAVFGIGSTQAVSFASGTFPDAAGADRWNWRNAAMYYFLSREPKSRSIIEALSGQMLTNKDASGVDLLIEIPTGAPRASWVRVVDAWGTPLDYRYDIDGTQIPSFPGTASFPEIRSAGPDKVPDTADDITNL